MKKLILTTVLCLGALCATAGIRFQSLNNENRTNIVLVDDCMPKNVEITDAVLLNDGREYPAKHIRCDLVDGVAKYKLTFKRLTKFKDCEVILTINGEKKVVKIKL